MPTAQRAGDVLYENSAVVTVAGSPLLSGWIPSGGFTQVIPFFVFAGGTSTHSIQGSVDGATQDADYTYAAPVSGTAFTITSPYFRWSTVQTVADATKSKVCLIARL